MNTKVDTVMRTEPMILRPDDDLREPSSCSLTRKIGGIPLVGQDKRLVAIGTYVDVLRRFAELLHEKD